MHKIPLQKSRDDGIIICKQSTNPVPTMITENDIITESQLSQKEKNRFWRVLPKRLGKTDFWETIICALRCSKARDLNYDFINRLSIETISKAYGEHGIHFKEHHNSEEKPSKYYVATLSPESHLTLTIKLLDNQCDCEMLRLFDISFAGVPIRKDRHAIIPEDILKLEAIFCQWCGNVMAWYEGFVKEQKIHSINDISLSALGKAMAKRNGWTFDEQDEGARRFMEFTATNRQKITLIVDTTDMAGCIKRMNDFEANFDLLNHLRPFVYCLANTIHYKWGLHNIKRPNDIARLCLDTASRHAWDCKLSQGGQKTYFSVRIGENKGAMLIFDDDDPNLAKSRLEYFAEHMDEFLPLLDFVVLRPTF